MKYVAFLDILGFKETLLNLRQNEAKHYIAEFSSVIYRIVNENESNLVTGYIVSDSLVFYTNDVSKKALSDMIKVIIEVCQKEFSENSILIRGAIAKGEFDKMPAVELPQLKKQLIVGQAYVDAYTLESTVKTIGVMMSKDVFYDLIEYDIYEKPITETVNKKTYYMLRYLSIDYLLEHQNINRFIELANDSGWLPHYYNAIYMSLKNENNNKKVNQLFDNIFDLFKDQKGQYRYSAADKFIRNAFDDKIFGDFQRRFLRYLREKVYAAHIDLLSNNNLTIKE